MRACAHSVGRSCIARVGWPSGTRIAQEVDGIAAPRPCHSAGNARHVPGVSTRSLSSGLAILCRSPATFAGAPSQIVAHAPEFVPVTAFCDPRLLWLRQLVLRASRTWNSPESLRLKLWDLDSLAEDALLLALDAPDADPRVYTALIGRLFPAIFGSRVHDERSVADGLALLLNLVACRHPVDMEASDIWKAFADLGQ